MASSMNLGNIPPSRDTIFMRGFSARQHIDDIREFFSHEGARNTVEFFKDDGNQQLFIALRFDSKDVAKDIIDRFDNTEILGDCVHMQFYKDLRRPRMPDYRSDFRRPMNTHRGGSDMYHNDDQYDYPRERNDRGGGGYGGGGGGGRRGSGGGMYSSGVKHSGGNGGWQGGQGGRDHQQQSVVTSRARRYTRSSSRSRSQTRSRSSSRSYSRSSSDSKHRKKRHGRKRKSSPSSSKRKQSRNAQASSQTPDRTSTQSRDSSVQRTKKTKKEKRNDRTSSSDRRPTAADIKTKNMESNASDAEMEADTSADNPKTDVNEETSKGTEQEGGKPVRTVRATGVGGAKLKRKPVAAAQVPPGSEDEDQQGSDVGSVEESDPAPVKNIKTNVKEPTKGKKVKEVIPPRRQYVEEQVSEEEEEEEEEEPVPTTVVKTSNPVLAAAATKKIGRVVENEDEPVIQSARAAQKPMARSKAADIVAGAGWNGGAYDDYEQNEAPPPTKQSRKKKLPVNEDMDEDDEEYEEENEPKRRRNDPSSREMRGRGNYDEQSSVPQSRKRPSFQVPQAPANLPPTPVNGRLTDPSVGVLSLSQEKVALIKSKKDDIEKAYRQDCETFATVTKMLISKDPELEERIQQSLRDNLKEIGQRCIQELREFVERVKSEEGIV